MFNSPIKKTIRDLSAHKGRSILVIISIALSTFILGVILNSYAILSREMNESFQQANPSGISYQIDQFNPSLLELIEKHPAIAKTEARRVIAAQIQNKQGEWHPAILYVLRDYNDIKLDILQEDEGNWPPKVGQILIERQALSVLDGNIDETVKIKSTLGDTTSFTVSGTTHDVVLAQAEWENLVYGYISHDSLQLMGMEKYFNRLNITLKDQSLSQEQLAPIADDIKNWLQKYNYPVTRFDIAKPNKHPHANITDGMFIIQKVFAIMCCILSSILVFNLISAILSRQLPQIGAMKSIGAKPMQIRMIYFTSVFLLGTLGITISLPLAYFAGNQYAVVLSKMMNFDISNFSIPYWVILTQIGLGLFIPLLTASIPIHQASKFTIRETFIEYGFQQSNTVRKGKSKNIFSKLLSSLAYLPLTSRLSVRNAIRRKARFILTTSILMVSGTLLMTTFNVSKSLKMTVVDDATSKNWDLKIEYPRKINQKTIRDSLLSIPQVENFESYLSSSVEIVDDKNNALLSIDIISLKPYSSMTNPKLVSGRWLIANQNEVVVNQVLVNRLPNIKLGSIIKLKSGKQSKLVTIVGIAKRLSMQMLFSDEQVFSELELAKSSKRFFYVVSKERDRHSINLLKDKITNNAKKNRLTIKSITTSWEDLLIIEDHFEIIFNLMFLLTLIVMLIAGNGIALTMVSNVLERTKEIGILKAIGASNKHIYQMLLSEGSLIAIVAWALAMLLTFPVSYIIVYALGSLLIATPLELTLESTIFFYSLPSMLVIACLASVVPAKRIIRLPVREALIYE